MGIGMISTVVPSGLLVIAIVVTNELAGVYGISIAAVGMLSTLGVTLATDAYGPVADNAGGLAEMCLTDDKDSYVRDRTDALDALGNTTAATGKGFAIGSAVLTSVGLIAAYMDETGLQTGDVDLQNPYVLCGALIGAMLPFLFGALTMLSVGRSAEAIILKVRAQFYVVNMEIKAGKYKDCTSWDDFDPNIHMTQADADVYYADCIEIATGSALREMLIPGFMAVVMPAVVGFLLGAPALAGLLVGALTSGFMLAVTMANAGGAWDNAKKYCEKGALGEGREKGSEAHAATVVGDTVGDPFKDTSGPALNILIKLMSIVSLVLAPVLKKCCQESFQEDGVIAGTILLAVLLLSSTFISRWINKLEEEFKAEVEQEKQKSISTINPIAKNGEAKNGEAKNGAADKEDSTSGAAVVPVDTA
jgi:H(+)-translocating pyrophosphatase